ncbi:MAG: helix-turn-helix domain-containing protein [bacterium]|nr:helix-turn-helix domain-containing protein [bacterium]
MSRRADYPKELLDAIARVTVKRPKTVLEHILKHGRITTEELREQYGYDHPPRAARDVREAGIPLKMTRVRGGSGRSIAQYVIDVERFQRQRTSSIGRRPIRAELKRALIARFGNLCEICQRHYDERDLQADHRVPFEIGGDPPLDDLDAFMVLCPPHNREKSWRCEHCPNWTAKNVAVCRQCFWANPSHHTHVAMTPTRRVDLTFADDDRRLFERLERESRGTGAPIQEIVKRTLRRASG